jgi:septum formation protein
MLGLPFTVMPSFIEETYPPGLSLPQIPEAIARKKVEAVVETSGIVKTAVAHMAPFAASQPSLAAPQAEPPAWVFGADTIVALDGRIFGKPADRADARCMLAVLQGRTHRVVSGIVLFRRGDGRYFSQSVTSEVTFAPLSLSEIDRYLDADEWQGAAGSYKVQGLAGCFIPRIQGSYTNIVGLPLAETMAMFKESGYLNSAER